MSQNFEQTYLQLRRAVLEFSGPVAVRYPKGGEGEFRGDTGPAGTCVLRTGRDITLLGYGGMINQLLDCARPLGFCSAEELWEYLRLIPGAVSPMGVLQAGGRGGEVEIAIDRELMSFQRIGLHPNRNDATLWIRPAALVTFLQRAGQQVTLLDLDGAGTEETRATSGNEP